MGAKVGAPPKLSSQWIFWPGKESESNFVKLVTEALLYLLLFIH